MTSIYSPRYQDLVKNIIINDAVNNCHRVHPDSCIARFIKHNSMFYSPIEYAVTQRKIKVLKSLYELPLKEPVRQVMLDQLAKAIHENNFEDLYKVLKKEKNQASSSGSLYVHPSLPVSESLEKESPSARTRSPSVRTRSPSLTIHSRDISEESIPSLNPELSISLSKTLPSCSSGLSESSTSTSPHGPAPYSSRALPPCLSELSESSISTPPRSPASSPSLHLSQTLPSRSTGLPGSSIRTPSCSPASSPSLSLSRTLPSLSRSSIRTPSLYSRKILSPSRNSEKLASSSKSPINLSRIEKRKISIFSMTEAKQHYQSLKLQSRTIIPDDKIIEYSIKLLTLGFKIYSRNRSFYNKIALDILDLLYLPIQRKNLHNIKLINKLARHYLNETRLIKMFTPLLKDFIKMEKNSSSLLNFHLEFLKLNYHFSKKNDNKILSLITNLLYLQKEIVLSPEQKYQIYLAIYPFIDEYKELQNLKSVLEQLVPLEPLAHQVPPPPKSCCTIL